MRSEVIASCPVSPVELMMIDEARTMIGHG